jgi:cytidyltransferase-like protein
MKVYDTGLICGRFQTFHKGHERLVDTGLLLCDRLLILIGSAQECGTELQNLIKQSMDIINETDKLLKEYDNE